MYPKNANNSKKKKTANSEQYATNLIVNPTQNKQKKKLEIQIRNIEKYTKGRDATESAAIQNL